MSWVRSGPGGWLFTRTGFTSRAASPSARGQLANPGNLLFLCISAIFLCAFHSSDCLPPSSYTPARWELLSRGSRGSRAAAAPGTRILPEGWDTVGMLGNAAGWRWAILSPGREVGGSPRAAVNQRSASQPAPILCLASCCITSTSL